MNNNENGGTSELIIRFIGKDRRDDPATGKTRFVAAKAPTQRSNGGRVIELPSSWQQKRGFAHPDAEFLLKTYPREFKRKVSKGEK